MTDSRVDQQGRESLFHARYDATVEAALDVLAHSQQLVGMDDPFGSQGPPILVGANAWFALSDALGNITSEKARELIGE